MNRMQHPVLQAYPRQQKIGVAFNAKAIASIVQRGVRVGSLLRQASPITGKEKKEIRESHLGSLPLSPPRYFQQPGQCLDSSSTM
jgi:hypothetical protein